MKTEGASAKGYLAGDREFLYPGAGDPKPPGGAKVHLLTEGGIAVDGSWKDNAGFVGWAPLPKRNREKEARLKERPYGTEDSGASSPRGDTDSQNDQG